MSKKIIFQKCNFNNIYFLCYIVAYFIDIFIEHNLESELSEKLKNYLSAKILDNLYIYNVSDFLAIIPFLIRKRLVNKKEDIITNKKIEDDKNESEDLELIYNDKELSENKKKKKRLIMLCILVGIFDFFERFAIILYNMIYPDKEFGPYTFNCGIPFSIALQFICSYFILKVHFYKLQYFSLFLNLGIFIIILIIDLINIIKHDAFDGKVYLFYSFSIAFYSMEYSYGKKTLINGFMSIHLLMIIKGIVGLILVLLVTLITYFINKDHILNIRYFFEQQKYVWLIIAKIFADYFVTLFIWILIDRFSPNYLPFTLIFDEVCDFLLEIIYNPNITKGTMKWDLYFRIFLYLISFICVMIHNEIVVINICNLGSDTKYFLAKEFEKEELFSKTDNPEIIQRYETLVEMEPIEENSRETKGEN